MLTPIMLGNKILEARKARNLSQAQLGQQLAISSQAVGKWERGESMPDILTFNRLAEILGVDLNYFSESFQSPTTTTPNPEKGSTAVAAVAAGVPPVEQPVESPPPSEMPEKKLSWDLSMATWMDADFSGLKYLGEKFSFSTLQKSLFIGSDISGLLLKYNTIDTCDFSNSDISKSNIKFTNFVNSSFRACSLQEAEFDYTQIKSCDFTGADFTGADFKSSHLLKSTVSGAIWKRTTFYSTQFADLVFDGTFNGCSFEGCYFSRVTFQNATLTDTFFKNDGMKRIRFINCKADKLTYAFLKSGKADMSGITLLI